MIVNTVHKFVVFQAIFIFYCVDYKPVTYGKSYTYPRWAEGLGFCMSFASMIWVPAYAIYYILAMPGTVKEVSEFSLITMALWHVSRKVFSF
jgi:solute carrier family 6 GABA transporter-like protein 1